jgi:hypothetical protein
MSRLRGEVIGDNPNSANFRHRPANSLSRVFNALRFGVSVVAALELRLNPAEPDLP